MRSNVWTHSIEKWENFSAGALRLYCRNASDLQNYTRSPFFRSELGVTSIGWTEVSEQTFGAHIFTFPAQETQDTPEAIPPELFARLYCHAVVSALPYEALPELVEDLRDLEVQFLKRSQVATQPANPALIVKAKVGSPVPRPEIHLDRE